MVARSAVARGGAVALKRITYIVDTNKKERAGGALKMKGIKMNEEKKSYILEVGGFTDSTNWRGLGAVEALAEQVRAVLGGRIKTVEQAGEYMAQGGQWEVYTAEAERVAREVFGLQGASWADYCRACGRAVAEILES